ncbi:MAG: AraC family transcriptional regulator [Oscillospiraceae bacterium]|nr:AraC family transcriptional regulator [Oscillospiraceae bacterium]MDD4369087.1 AraC family transcriptional regulator [Oscillospiraceae bacterium]
MSEASNIRSAEALKRRLQEERLTNQLQAYQHPPYLLEHKLLALIEQADSAQAMAVLHQINSLERAKLAADPIRSLKNSLIASCTLFTRAAIQAGAESEAAFMLSDLYIRRVEAVGSRQQAENLEYDMLLDFCRLAGENRHADSPLVHRARHYIQRHLQSRLSLNDIADYVGCHPNYLSTRFSQETGQSLMSYYDQERMGAICRFLTDTELPLLEIAALFEFSSLSYFSAAFKKTVGQSPSDYRRRARRLGVSGSGETPAP